MLRWMRSFVYLLFLCSLLVACSESKHALDTWVHADAGSYGAATILDLKLDTNARTLISESSSGIGQRWAFN